MTVKQAKPKADAKVDEECVICMTKPKDTMCYPCGHKCMCNSCATKMKNKGGAKCPMCRADIKDVVKVFA